jgi:hypothetical protein
MLLSFAGWTWIMKGKQSVFSLAYLVNCHEFTKLCSLKNLFMLSFVVICKFILNYRGLTTLRNLKYVTKTSRVIETFWSMPYVVINCWGFPFITDCHNVYLMQNFTIIQIPQELWIPEQTSSPRQRNKQNYSQCTDDGAFLILLCLFLFIMKYICVQITCHG